MIETNSPQLQEVWDSFLKEWPLTRLRQMKLREYTAAGQDRTFTAWIERRLDKMGSIWGGSSFKFGIFLAETRLPNQPETLLHIQRTTLGTPNTEPTLKTRLRR